jgi:hypothetical protein
MQLAFDEDATSGLSLAVEDDAPLGSQAALISPSFAPQESLAEISEQELEDLHVDQLVNSSRTSADLEATSNDFELRLAATEVALGMFRERLARMHPREDAARIVRGYFTIGRMRNSIAQYERSVRLLRRAADRKASQIEAVAPTDVNPKRTKRSKPVLLRDGRPVRPETKEERRVRLYQQRMSAASAHGSPALGTLPQFTAARS